MLSEREAWLYLAERWSKHGVRFQNGKWGALVAGFRCLGLCHSVQTLREMNEWVTVSTSKRMRMRIRGERRRMKMKIGKKVAYLWGRTKRGAQQRAAFCRRCALKIARR